MNRLAATRTTAAPLQDFSCAQIVLNGQRALCDPLGALFLPDHDLLVVSDLHLEKGAAFARRGQLLPPYDTLSTLTLLQAVIARHNPKIVISLGDNFHDRNGAALLPDLYRTMIAEMARGRQWIWINGNHDPDGASGLPGESIDTLCYAGLTFRHEPGIGVFPGEVAGHLHPAATVRRREKSVRRPCFASDGVRLVMPAFGVMTGGLDLGHRAFAGLFNRSALIAHLLGRDRIYSVRLENLLG
ncbi:MAG: ligase-associated DNA damage response endonuclease PdeM [Allorhizobium sp.]